MDFQGEQEFGHLGPGLAKDLLDLGFRNPFFDFTKVPFGIGLSPGGFTPSTPTRSRTQSGTPLREKRKSFPLVSILEAFFSACALSRPYG